MCAITWPKARDSSPRRKAPARNSGLACIAVCNRRRAACTRPGALPRTTRQQATSTCSSGCRRLRRALFAPERARKEYQEGEQLDAPEEHRQRADPGLLVAQRAVVGCRPYLAQARTRVVDGRDGCSHRADEIHVGG